MGAKNVLRMLRGASESMKNETAYGTIRAKYRFIDGYHVFTSEDVRGLYVASRDAKVAFEEVATVLEDLITRKIKGACEVRATLSFQDFLRATTGQEPSPSATPVLQDREFVIRCAA